MRILYFKSIARKSVVLYIMSSKPITPHLIGSAERWGDQAYARICKIVIDHNDGINQSVMENRTDLFDILTNDELIRGDDLGLSVAYSAIYYDQPDIIVYLHGRGVDLSQPCDPLGYGTPYFYAIMMSRFRLIVLLHKLGYSLHKPCETTFNQTPLHYAKKKGNGEVLEFISKVVTMEARAKTMLHKNVMRRYYYRKYQAIKKKIIILQSIYRRRLAKKLVQGIRNGTIILGSDSEEEGEDDDYEDETNDFKSKTNLSHVEEESNEDDESIDVAAKEIGNQDEDEEEEEDDQQDNDDDDEEDDS